MPVSNTPETEILTWHEARKMVKKVNPELVDHIDILDPGPELKLFKVRFPYGADIIKEGQLHLPFEGEMLPISDVRHPAEIRQGLAYAHTMPMGLVLNNGIELHFNSNKHMIPFTAMTAGKIFALAGVLETESAYPRGSIFNITAGARSLFMLPKITNTQSHTRLISEFDLTQSAPEYLYDQFHLFRSIYKKADIPNEKAWYCDCIFFDGKWLENKVDFNWRSFRYFLLQAVWNGMSYWRDQAVSDFLISISQKNRGMKPDPYLIDTLKHLFAIGLGAFPGYGVATDDTLAPIGFIQKVYEEVYRLNSAPILMQPMHANPLKTDQQLYYSLNVPSLRSFSPKGKKLASKISDMRDLKRITRMISQEIDQNPFNIGEGRISLYTLIKHSEFDFYHTEVDPFGEIRAAKELPSTDGALREVISRSRRDIFNINSAFLKGCIAVRHK